MYTRLTTWLQLLQIMCYVLLAKKLPNTAVTLDLIHSSVAFYSMGIATHDIWWGADGNGSKHVDALEKNTIQT